MVKKFKVCEEHTLTDSRLLIGEWVVENSSSENECQSENECHICGCIDPAFIIKAFYVKTAKVGFDLGLEGLKGVYEICAPDESPT